MRRIMEDSEINSIPAKNQNDYLKARNNFLENIPITVFETNKQGYIIQTNKYGCDLFGYTAEEVAAGKVHFTDLISAEDVGRAVMNFQQIFNDKVLKNSEYKAKKRNGEELDILIQGEMVKEDDIVVGIRGYLIDITKRKQMENELSLFKKLADTAPLAVSVRNVDGRLIYLNEARAKLLGIEHTKSNKINEDDFYTHSSLKILAKETISCVEAERIWEGELEIINSAGKKIPVLLLGNSMISVDGKTRYLYSFEHNISKQKQIEQDMEMLIDKLRQANEKLSYESNRQAEVNEQLSKSEQEMKAALEQRNKFFDIIAHDLTSPFNGFLGLLEELTDDFYKLKLSEIKEMTNLINKSAVNLHKLLRNLLEWSRSQTGRLTVNAENLHLWLISKETLQQLTPSLALKNIKVVNDISKDLVVFADRNLLNTVISNLVQNAIKFSERGTEIRLESVKKELHIEISVIDQGEGIEPDSLENLFSIDKKNNTLGTEGEQGTGLGLILCKEFINIMNGEIWVESKPGKGSKFTFTLLKG